MMDWKIYTISAALIIAALLVTYLFWFAPDEAEVEREEVEGVVNLPSPETGGNVC